MDNYYFQETKFLGIWELGSLDPVKIEETKYAGYCRLKNSDPRVRKLMNFLGLKYRARNIVNPQSMVSLGWHIDFEDGIAVGNPQPWMLKKWPWMIILIATNEKKALGTRIRKNSFRAGYLENWKIYLMHRCILHDSPEDQDYTRFLNRYDIHQFPEPNCLHNYRRKLRKKHIAIAQALLKD